MSSPFFAYTNRLSALPGDVVELKVSTSASSFQSKLVVVRGAELAEERQILDVVPVSGLGPTRHVGREQPLALGSYARVDDCACLSLSNSGTVRVLIMPTLLPNRPSAVVARWDETTSTGWWVGVVDGKATLILSDGVSRCELRSAQLETWTWYCIAAAWNATTGRAEVAVKPVANSANSRRSALCDPQITARTSGVAVAPGQCSAPTCIAAHWSSANGAAGGHFNGKIESPTIWSQAMDVGNVCKLELDPALTESPLVEWNFADGISADGIPGSLCMDRGPKGLHATLIGQPSRAVTGALWTGDEHVFTRAPAQYAAIHFHEDDLEDAQWESDVIVELPHDCHSGLYAFHLSDGEGGEDYYPFWVRPGPGDQRADVLLLFPTATYLAYANDREGTEGDLAEAQGAHTYVITNTELKIAANPGVGLSLYDEHVDGSGVGYSSARRPIPNMRPHNRHASGSVWGLAADVHIVNWLNQIDEPFDVATDEDLEREGRELLRQYKVVITGSHPEYCSAGSLDAFENYLGVGGRVMYLGANGFYWVASPHPTKGHLLEVRRGTSGTRAWESAPGEHYHAFTGELGGLWRHRGRAPQKLFGVGFSGEGFDRSSGYVTLSDWHDPNLTWAVEGLQETTDFGTFGWVGDGAAGHEVDRYDLALGSPLDAYVLATSAGLHSANYMRATEELGINRPGATGPEDPMLRADVTIFATESGGAVFATGSIAWAGALAHNKFRNPISQLTTNVLRRLLEPTPITREGRP